MDVREMTVEGFFLTDYVRLRQECEELKAKLGSVSPSGCGVFDLGHPTDAFMMTANVVPNDHEDYGLTIDDIVEASKMDDNALWTWSCACFMRKDGRRSAYRPIRVEHRRFQYTLRIVETRHDWVFVTDGNNPYERNLIRLEAWEGEECLGVWQDESRFDYVKREALSMLRRYLDRAIGRESERTDA